MIEYDGQLKNEAFNIRKVRSHHKNGADKLYCDDIFTFDIETTSAWINEYGNVIRYAPGKSSKYWNNLEKLALCYIWQLSYNDTVYFGRELTDFKKVLTDFPKDATTYIWIHNAAFELAFLFNIFSGVEVFARAPHKPLYFKAKEFPNIEFRCSYMLTRLSLDSWGKSLGVPKLTGALNYEKLRTPLTVLTTEELAYCEQDCKVVHAGVKAYLKRYHTQDKIPLTQTGTVRREVKNKLCIYPEYLREIKKLCPVNAKEYKMLQRVFAGGYTHANRLYAGKVQKALYNSLGAPVISHWDFASAYPKELVKNRYPCTPWAYIGKKLPDPKTFEDNAYILHLRFTNIECMTYNTYIQAYKCSLDNPYKLDNGRVLLAKGLETWITEQDYLTISDTYRWEDIEVLGVYQSTKDYLPTPFIEYVLQLYGNKTSLKGVKGKEDLYAQSKQYINALFGMCVTSIVQADINLSEKYEWNIGKLTEEEVNKKLDSLRNGWKRDKRYFLSYSWGIYCTSFARRSLWLCLLGKKIAPYKYENDERVLYADTDSLFMLGEADFTDYNNQVIKELEKACNHHGLKPALISPKTPKGKEKPLGIFDREENITEFLTLGAKRYCERREDGKLYLTVSGINKAAVYCLNDDIENFKDGFDFDKDFPTVKKRLLTYLTDMPEITYPDGYKSSYKYGINLRRNGYVLTMDSEYKKLINYVNYNLSALSDEFKNSMRGRWTK